MALYKFVTDIEQAIMYFSEGNDDQGHKKLNDAKCAYNSLGCEDRGIVDGVLGKAKEEIFGDNGRMLNHPLLEKLVKRWINID